MLTGGNEGILDCKGQVEPLSTSLHAPGQALAIRAGIQVQQKPTLPSQGPSPGVTQTLTQINTQTEDPTSLLEEISVTQKDKHHWLQKAETILLRVLALVKINWAGWNWMETFFLSTIFFSEKVGGELWQAHVPKDRDGTQRFLAGLPGGLCRTGSKPQQCEHRRHSWWSCPTSCYLNS